MKQGTVSREGVYVRGTCEEAPEGHAVDVLVYLIEPIDALVCADHARLWAKANPRKETCDGCGHEGAWRDPLTRRNEFFCAVCHANNGTVFQNRWALKARESEGLGMRAKPACSLAGYGTECKGEVKWRGSLNALACNKHAGKQSAGPEHHQ